MRTRQRINRRLGKVREQQSVPACISNRRDAKLRASGRQSPLLTLGEHDDRARRCLHFEVKADIDTWVIQGQVDEKHFWCRFSECSWDRRLPVPRAGLLCCGRSGGGRSRGALPGSGSIESRSKNRSRACCDVASCSKFCKKSSHSVSGWEFGGNQKRHKEPNCRLRKKIDRGKIPSVPVRLSNVEKRGLLSGRQ